MLLAGFVSSAHAEESLLVRTVALDISSYPEAANLDDVDKTADGTVNFLNSTKPLLVHMEALRRSYAVYGENADEKNKLMKALKDRYMAEPENAAKYFDYGYAQLVMTADKNGLFFLRKANDKLANPYTNLAYGITQIDTDLAFENKAPDDMTPRKMDAMYKIKDALTYNKEDVLPGIWPSFIHVLEGIKSYPAYENLRTEDLSTIYVPYGNACLSRGSADATVLLSLKETGTNPEITSTAPPVPTADAGGDTTKTVTVCSFTAKPNWSKLYTTKSMDLQNDGKSYSINFFNTDTGKPYDVIVLNPDNNVVGAFSSYKAPYIIEDLDNDGKYELVVRQYDKDPYHPLYVYRWNGSCYSEDQQVSAYFK